MEFEVTKTLRDIDLVDKANVSAKHLSGGQKRKLSIGIAVIGDPKVNMSIKYSFKTSQIFKRVFLLIRTHNNGLWFFQIYLYYEIYQ